jgi:DNA-binding MarR family transcriptional regulator
MVTSPEASKELRRVFVGAHLEQLLKLITDQGEEISKDAGVTFPPRASPTLLLLMKGGPMSVADLAKELSQPHQLVTQRITTLIDSGVVARSVDPADARRKILTITESGMTQLHRLNEYLRKIEVAYVELFDEIGCDVAAVALAMIEALTRRSLRDRLG